MKASSLIGCDVVHTTDPDITGTVTDILFDQSLDETAFFLADVTTTEGTAPILLSPVVLAFEGGILKVSAHPDDITARVSAAVHQTPVDLDPSALPNMFIGPFGNTFSPSMIVALFNARHGIEKPEPPTKSAGVWMTEVQDHAVSMHVAQVGRVRDIDLDDDLSGCDSIHILGGDDVVITVPPENVMVDRTSDDAMIISMKQSAISPD